MHLCRKGIIWFIFLTLIVALCIFFAYILSYAIDIHKANRDYYNLNG